jgi:glycosyltransferase involved in cell wall biosynthesis
LKVLFLYTELAAYVLKCCEELSRHAEVHIVKWPVNQEAPFNFKEFPGLNLYDRNDYTGTELRKLAHEISPDVIVCSGWIDKDYVRVCHSFRRSRPVVLALDTHWRGGLKQQIAAVAGKILLKKVFTHAWVPGEMQAEYARKLGFKGDRISFGFYCSDTDFFNDVCSQRQASFSNVKPRLIYAGRYYDFKGIEEMWEAFIQLKNELTNDWELWCIGTGSVKPREHASIKHFGFVQPENMPGYMSTCAAFILPSRYEPWGVVVHEFAAAGFPLLLSDQVGAATAFLTDGKNGYRFKAGNVDAIKAAMKKIMQIPVKDLFLMGAESHRLAQKITPELWVSTLIEIERNWNEEKNTDYRGSGQHRRGAG